MSEGASLASICGLMREAKDMLANGFAIIAGTPMRAATISSIPGIWAQPPASSSWSTLLNGLDE
jgi:hypothetical protein